MARKLTAGVVLRDPRSGAIAFLPEGAELPSWASGMVGDHVLSAAAEPAPSPVTVAPAVEPEPGDEPPPKSGRGSSDANWTAYARANGVAVTDDMSRREVIDACDTAGIPT